MELFVSQGYDETTVDQIAADVARGTFFNCFPGEENVPHAAIERRRKELRDVIAATTAPDATTRILDGLKTLAALYDADSATRRPMLRIWIRCAGPFGPGHGQTAEYIRAFLDEGQSAGNVRKDLDTSAAGLVLQDVYIGALLPVGKVRNRLPRATPPTRPRAHDAAPAAIANGRAWRSRRPQRA